MASRFSFYRNIEKKYLSIRCEMNYNYSEFFVNFTDF